MIIIRFHGGLGNQMFEYGFYKYMQKKYGKLVYGDLTWFDRNHKEHQGYELENVFGIKVKAATYDDIARIHEYYPRYYPFAALRYLSRKNAARKNKGRDTSASHIFDFGPTQYIKNERFDNLDIEKDWYIEGVFCSDRYISVYEEELKRDLTFKSSIDKTNSEVAQMIEKTNSVAIHVRRGDYVGNVFDILGTEYYEAAVQYIEQHVDNPKFFVFSDDMEYVKNEFKFLKEYIPVHSAGKKSYQDMQLMAMCKHMIIANSSFSYFGALLGEKDNSIVVAPKQYKRDEEVSLSRDRWIKL